MIAVFLTTKAPFLCSVNPPILWNIPQSIFEYILFEKSQRTWLTEDRSRTYLICLWRPVDLSFSKTFVDRFFRIFHSILRGTSLYKNIFTANNYADLRSEDPARPKLTKSSSSVLIISSSVFDSDIFLKIVSVFLGFLSGSLFIKNSSFEFFSLGDYLFNAG